MDVLDQISVIEETDAHLETIKDSVIKAVKVPLITGRDLYGKPEPETYGVYREGGGDCLGVVGSVFRPANLGQFVDAIRDSVYQSGASLDLRKLTYAEHYGGRKVNFQIPVRDLIVGPAKVGDVTKISLNFWTGFDGNTQFQLSGSAYRIWCSNLCGMWEDFQTLRFKNTLAAQAKVTLFADEIVREIAEIDNYEEFLQASFSKKVDKAQVDAFINATLGYEDYTVLEKKQKARAERLIEAIDVEFAHTDVNVYSLLQGATRFTTHNAKDESDVLIKPSITKVNSRAHNFAAHLLN